MEFAGKRGDAISPWSVGKYAKRSATIHLCSEDCQVKDDSSFRGTVVGYVPNQGGFGNVTVFDRAVNGVNLIRAEIPRLAANEGFVRIRNPASGLTYDTSTVTLGGIAGDGVLTVGGVNVADFTVLALGNQNFRGLNDESNIFTPARVREVDNSQAVYPNDYAHVGTRGKMVVASQGLATANSKFRIYRSGTTYTFMLPVDVFPNIADAGVSHADEVVRLCGDARQGSTTYPADQIDKGYVLELINWDQTDGSENDISDADQYFVTGCTYTGARSLGSPAVSFLELATDEANIPANLYAVLNPLLTAHNGELFLGGVAYVGPATAGAEVRSAANAVEGRDTHNTAGRIFTFNLLPATQIDPSSHGFASSTDNHCNYTVTIPNTIGYPEHKRCLVQVQSLSCHTEALFAPDHTNRLNPVYVGVEVQGLGAQSNFSSHVTLSKDNRFDGKVANSNVVAYLNLTSGDNALSYQNNRSILDDGVLCSSPFGKQLRIKLLNLTNKDLLNTNATTATAIRDHTDLTDLINNPTHLTLRLLFLDDDDLPMR